MANNGWVDTESNTDDEDDPYAVTEDVCSRARKLSKTKQIEFWIGRLKEIAKNTKLDPDDYDFDVDSNLEQLGELGVVAVIPMLKLACELAKKPQYSSDGDETRELYRSLVLNGLIHNVKEVDHTSGEVEKLIQKVVANSVKANRGQKIWGDAPFFAAQTLYALFDGYPCPENEDNNALVNPEPFMK